MSAKKSWDVVRREPAKRVEAAPPPASRGPRKPNAPRVSTRDVENPRGKRFQSASQKPLKVRRKQERKRFWIFLSVFIVLLVAGLFYLLWLPILRIQVVQADGGSAGDLQAIASRDMRGAYLFIIPKSSIFFVPQKAIRTDILSAHPEIEALSISAKGLNTLTIHSVERASAFWWCGTDATVPSEQCYDTNAAGLIFQPASGFSTSSTATLRLYGTIDATTTDTFYPLGAHIQGAGTLPNALRFVKAIKGLGVNVVALSLRGDEADLYTDKHTRITYVLGKEQQAAGLAATAFPQLSVNDGSLEYVDLRFTGKVYFKKKGE